jgi:hypothetical protein
MAHFHLSRKRTIVAGWWVIDTMRCDPLESDLALVKSDACR